jgi:hypothetical protein
MNDPNLTLRENLHSALVRWAAAQNVTGQVATFGVTFPAEFGDDTPLDPVRMYETPGSILEKLLDTDSAGRAGLAPGSDDPFAELRYAAARLNYLLAPEHPGRCSGWPQPPDAAEALGELARLAEQVPALAEQADQIIGRELRDWRLIPAPAAAADQARERSAASARLGKKLHDSAAATRSELDKAAQELRRMQLRVRELRRTMQAAVAGPGDGPTPNRQYLVRCKPLGWSAVYHVRIFRPHRQRPLVIIGELGDSYSTSVTNGAEKIASAISEHILHTRDENAAIWVQYEPAEQYFYPPLPDDDSDHASLHSREDQAQLLLFEPGFTGVGWRPRWSTSTRGEASASRRASSGTRWLGTHRRHLSRGPSCATCVPWRPAGPHETGRSPCYHCSRARVLPRSRPWTWPTSS